LPRLTWQFNKILPRPNWYLSAAARGYLNSVLSV
jgi:hypothetical protein